MARALKMTIATDAERWHARLYFLQPLLRLSIGLLWLVTGLLSLFVYPVEFSYALLARLGIEGWLAPAALYSAGLLDVALGVATLANVYLVWVGGLQVLMMLGYTLLITVGLPEYWIHPFGPVTKNLPLLVATLMMMAMVRRAG